MAFFDFFSVPAILIACLINMFTGAVRPPSRPRFRLSLHRVNLDPPSLPQMWYSPLLFGNAFIRLAHPKTKLSDVKPDNLAMASAAVGTFMSMPFFCFLLSIARVAGPGEGMLWGAAVALIFDTGLNLPHSFFEARPFALFVMHRAEHAISLMMSGAVLGALCSGR